MQNAPIVNDDVSGCRHVSPAGAAGAGRGEAGGGGGGDRGSRGEKLHVSGEEEEAAHGR